MTGDDTVTVTPELPDGGAAAAAAAVPPPEPPPPDDPLARAAELRAQAAALEASVPAPPGTARLKVAAPHAEFRYAGVTVRAEWTQVPANRVTALLLSAAEAGVTLIREG